MPYSVYDVIDPRDSIPFYVGFTDNPIERLNGHAFASDSRNPQKYARIVEIIEEGFFPVLHVIEEGDDKTCMLRREKFWIQDYLSKGINLLNAYSLSLDDEWIDTRKACIITGLPQIGTLFIRLASEFGLEIRHRDNVTLYHCEALDGFILWMEQHYPGVMHPGGIHNG